MIDSQKITRRKNSKMAKVIAPTVVVQLWYMCVHARVSCVFNVQSLKDPNDKKYINESDLWNAVTITVSGLRSPCLRTI